MEYFPLFFNLNKQPCLLVGGGEVATRKARLIANAGAVINVCAPEVTAELFNLCLQSGGNITRREYHIDELKHNVLVISATNSAVVNAEVSRDCKQRNIPVNVVDSPALCSVITPSIVDRSPIVIAVSSGGESPVLTRKIRSELESSFPSRYGDLAQLASQYREPVKQAFADIELRRRFWESVLNGPIAEEVLAGNTKGAEELLKISLRDSRVDEHGEVYLVGAGPGDPDLLTFKALRLMQKAEVVLYDRLVSQAILDMVRRDAERIYVGKKRSDHVVEQAEINQMLLAYAQQGKRVLRLKGGDPFIFGRGGEEIDLLAKNNITFQIVPGITAASGCACYAGIPLTHRDYSQSVRFITGHSKDGDLAYPWDEFVSDQQTLVFYMGLISLPLICKNLIEFGKSPDTPAAVVEKGTMPDQRVHIESIKNLPELIDQQNVHAPTLLIIGDVVKLHSQLNWYKNQPNDADINS